MRKKFWQSKTFWTGVGAIITGAGLIYVGDVANGLEMIAGGLGMIFVRDAIASLDKRLPFK